MSQDGSVSDGEKLLYILTSNSQNQKIHGRKKLMKLVFFAEHFDHESGQLVPQNLLNSFDFEIFKYGPFSRKVLDKFDSLERNGLIREDSSRMQHVIKITPDGVTQSQSIGERLSSQEREHLQEIVQEFSDQSGATLETRSLNYLGIEKREKDRYRGTDVSDIIDDHNPTASTNG